MLREGAELLSIWKRKSKAAISFKNSLLQHQVVTHKGINLIMIYVSYWSFFPLQLLCYLNSENFKRQGASKPCWRPTGGWVSSSSLIWYNHLTKHYCWYLFHFLGESKPNILCSLACYGGVPLVCGRVPRLMRSLTLLNKIDLPICLLLLEHW